MVPTLDTPSNERPTDLQGCAKLTGNAHPVTVALQWSRTPLCSDGWEGVVCIGSRKRPDRRLRPYGCLRHGRSGRVSAQCRGAGCSL